MPEQAVLIVNLGSPDSASIPDVRRYLAEFLGDPRVFDPPQPLRWFLLNLVILRTRPKSSAHAYSTIWQPEGSPLILTSRALRDRIEEKAGVTVELAMRYGSPSIPDAIARLKRAGVRRLLLFPQYPHYAMSSYETVVVRVHEVVRELAPEMIVETIQPFFNDPGYIGALVQSARPYLDQPNDHLLFSYHGVPERHLRKADSSRAHCTVVDNCCSVASPVHATCYRAQLLATTREFVRAAGLQDGKWSVSYQSRLAGEPWLEPYTDVEIVRLAETGVKRLLVITPAFTADCLETLEEINVAGRKAFLEAGGESFEQIPCLNLHPAWLDYLLNRIDQWRETGAVA